MLQAVPGAQMMSNRGPAVEAENSFPGDCKEGLMEKMDDTEWMERSVPSGRPGE